MSTHILLGEEHPYSDIMQIIMLFLLILAWIIDSFYLKILNHKIPLIVRLVASFLLFGLGGYLVFKSHSLVLEAEDPVLVTWGVYSLSRHPMYLGSMLIELGVTVSTLSVLGFIVLVIIFTVYDWYARYEEKSLLGKIGQEYEEYMKKTRRWGISRLHNR
jgi:protein-S-isoprenylcysteine O-methyltransferase Ste14